MSNHAPEHPHGPGYVLSEDSRFRLLTLGRSIDVLSRLARPRRTDEAGASGPALTVDELATCLAPLAEQAAHVLDEVMRRPGQAAQADASAPDAAAATATDGAEADASVHAGADGSDHDHAGAGFDAGASPALPDGQRYVVGLTVRQIDAIDHLVRMLSAHGDVISASWNAALSESTLPLLGHAIFDHAAALRDILDEVGTQQLAPGRVPRAEAREARAAYAVAPVVPSTCPAAFAASGRGRRRRPAGTPAAGPQPGTRLH